MSDAPDDLQRKMAELEALRPSLGDTAVDAALAALKAQAAAPPAPPPPNVQGQAQVGGDNSGQNIGVNTGIALAIFGNDSKADERRQVGWYLEKLIRTLDEVSLQGIEERKDGQGQPLSLAQLYVALATTSTTTLARGTPEALAAYLDDPDDLRREGVTTLRAVKKAYHPDYALPAQAIVAVQPRDTATRRRDAVAEWDLLRAQLALEAVQQHPRLVLLGAPGSGKSTFMRHLAVLTAQPPRQDAPTPARLPLLLSLQQLARALAATPTTPPVAVIEATLIQLVRDAGCDRAERIVTEALRSGAVLVLFDGLDEVPLAGVAGRVASRKTTLEAVATFVRTAIPATAGVVLTCRERAFTAALRDCIGWHVETLAPFTLGQVRAFVPAWYTALASVTGLQAAQVAGYSTTLIERITPSAQLREMAQTPLLLTMMALVLYNDTELPRDRPHLYERVLRLLLGQWDKAGQKGGTLGEAIGLPDWDSKRFLPLLDRLSYEAHRTASSADGRGRLPKREVREHLIGFFVEAEFPDATAMAKTGLLLEYIEQRSGLLSPDADDSYMFAHLTFQEHCAGRDLVIGREPLARILAHRSDDRWREPIFLGLGVVQPSNPFLIESVLRALVNRDEGDEAKPAARWYRDLILAAELGNDRDWGYLRQQEVDVRGVQKTLRQGLVTLLGDPASGLEQRERIRAGVVLGELGDPRCPTTLAEWQAQLAQRSTTFGQPHGYFCYVTKGTYAVGGWDKDVPNQPATPAVQHKLKPYWIARYPITNAQFGPFVKGDGYTNGGYWTPKGWAWRTRNTRTEPYYWDDARYNQANQPVVGVTWYEVMAYAAWLTQQLTGVLPEGYEIRLPTEAEWEVAAAYNVQGTRRHYPWGNKPKPDSDRAIFKDAQGNNLGAAAPVGVCAAGAAACGAADMAGNVWEWCASSFKGYPQAAADFKKDVTGDDGYPPLRGGSWYFGSTYMPCGARIRYHPDSWNIGNSGVRVVCAPCLR